jgi:hypothetical protein
MAPVEFTGVVKPSPKKPRYNADLSAVSIHPESPRLRERTNLT